MKKALIPAAILMLAGAAHAELALYGLIDLSYGKNTLPVNSADDDKKSAFFSGGDGNHGNSTSRFGIKGSTDVGSGLKVNFKLESAGITSTGDVNSSQPFFARQAWAGVSGSFGEVRAGRQDSVAFQTMVGFDANGASNVASAWDYSGVAPFGVGRQIGVAQYISPNMGGLKVQVSLQPEGDALAQYGAGAKANYGLGVTYATGPLTLAVTGQSKTTDAGENFSAVAGSYDFGFLKAALTYTDAGDNAKGLGLSVSTTLAGYTMGVQYAKNSEGDKAKVYELFVNKEVLKNTYLYADFARKTVTGGTAGNGYAVGAIYTF